MEYLKEAGDINLFKSNFAGDTLDLGGFRNFIHRKDITKKIIEKVENSSFFLLEKLTDVILNIVLENPLVCESSVRVDKPNALRFADSVSVELSKKR